MQSSSKVTKKQVNGSMSMNLFGKSPQGNMKQRPATVNTSQMSMLIKSSSQQNDDMYNLAATKDQI